MPDSGSANTYSSPPRARTSCRFDLSFSSRSLFGATAIDRHVCVDERERAVLQLAGRIRLGVDVRDFLELQRAFHRDRVHLAAAEEQRVMLVGEALRQLADLAVEMQRLLDQPGNLDQALHQPALALGVSAVELGERDAPACRAQRAAS